MTNPLELPFDTEEMIAGLRPWIETESPTFDAGAVNRMMDLVQHELAALGARVERIPGRMDRTGLQPRQAFSRQPSTEEQSETKKRLPSSPHSCNAGWLRGRSLLTAIPLLKRETGTAR